MSGPSPSDGNGRAEISENGAGVLANLPRTRPQRATARRAAARRSGSTGRADAATTAAAENGAETAKTRPPAARARRTAAAAKSAKATPTSAAERAPRPAGKAAPARRAAQAKTAPPVSEPVPRQGYECLEERATGAVAPPGGADLVNTALEALSELAKASLTGGERLLRDLLGRLPG